jgi:hypothetical protein
MTIDVEEEMTHTALLNHVWKRIQAPLCRHLDNLPAKSTSYLPRSITVSRPYHVKDRGISTVTIDLSNEHSRRQTELIIYNKEREYVSAQTFRDGQLVRSEGRQ